MSVFCKLSLSLLSRSYRFRKSAKCLSRGINISRRVIPLRFVENNADIKDTLAKKDVSDAEWQNIRDKCLQIQDVTPFTVDTIIIDMCMKHSVLDSAIAYFKFLRQNNYALNAAVIGKYLRIYSFKGNLDDLEKAEILQTYHDLRKKYPVLDAFTTEHCIASLCCTDQWKEAFEMLEMLKITQKPSGTIYSVLAAAAFKNREPDIAWRTLSQISHTQVPRNNIYTSYLSYCKQEGKEAFNKNMLKMFDFWSEHNIRIHNKIIQAYADVASEYGWVGKPTTISKTGICKHCGHSLSKIVIRQDAFQKLANSVANKLIIGSDIYHNTDPEEFRNFRQFVEKTKPYDIVIDGLNLTYISKNSPGMVTFIFLKLYNYKWPVLQQIQAYASVFYIDNLSEDDPYILYATMASGINAMFVSSDLLRQHKHSFKKLNLYQEFHHWQCSHQYSLIKFNKSIRIQKPFVYLPSAQKNDDHWHIPYVADDCTMTNFDFHEFPDKWYCLRQEKKYT
ncbi:hypothetical protein DMN91_005443 [Ooceraea biroi]|uniref:ribonuclease P n=1 Tax=Ooceraea biroi TaxID=2015173 RepID=A0A3L8DRT9_OOCBI|nr:hypothetical protein DMN91_005443 [Ooceraea biroi]